MTSIYFVRHAKPNHCWEDDRTRPLSEEGVADSEQVVKKLQDISFDYAVSSPYLRSVDTIKECAKNHNLEIHMDERLREREKGAEGNNFTMFRKRWGDFDYHEKGGESLRMVQDRNMEAIMELLEYHEGENILVGTHGTALSTILNYFNPTFLEKGVSIPKDFSIIGFDDIPLAAMVYPPLTTVSQDLERRSKVAVELLLELINGESEGRMVLLPVEVVERGSVRHLRN